MFLSLLDFLNPLCNIYFTKSIEAQTRSNRPPSFRLKSGETAFKESPTTIGKPSGTTLKKGLGIAVAVGLFTLITLIEKP